MITLSPPAHNISGALHLGGSKSLSNRLLVLDHIFNAGFMLHNCSDAEDSLLLRQALEQIKTSDNGTIDVHHAGTDMRFLSALLCVTHGTRVLTGSERMKQRPVGELVTALRALGADITYLGKEGFPPLQIHGKKLAGGKIEIDGSISSQFISALLLISPTFEHGLELVLKNNIVSRPYIDMTLALLQQFNVAIASSGNTITIKPSPLPEWSSISYNVESDWSSASYWYSVCALSKQAQITLSSFYAKSLQADSVLPQLYETLGVSTVFKGDTLQLSHKGCSFHTFRYDFTNCPDIAQTVAATCVGLGLEAELTGLQTLSIKETDRLAALKQELEKTGAKVHITGHSLRLVPAKRKPAESMTFSTYNDHRMAMSLAPLALVFGSVSIDHPQVVDKSYPRFWSDLKSLGFNVHLQP